MLITYPLMAAIQEISGRIGRVTGHGIAGNVCRNYPAPVIWSLIVLLFVANTINVAADLGAMGDALKLLIGGPGPLYVLIFGTVSVLAQIFFKYERYVAILKWLTLVLFAYVIALFVVKVPWGEALAGLAHPENPVERRIPDNARRHSRNNDLALPVHLAVFAGGGRAAHRSRQKAAEERSPGKNRKRSGVSALTRSSAWGSQTLSPSRSS